MRASKRRANFLIWAECPFEIYPVGVDRLSAPILSILPIIDIGHFQNIFADNIFLLL